MNIRLAFTQSSTPAFHFFSMDRRSAPKRIVRGLFAASLLACVTGGCGLFDQTITLQPQEFKQNFGTSMGTVPNVPCTTAADPCMQVANMVSGSVMGATAKGVCDTASQKCTAEVTATLSYPITLSKEQNFATMVAGKAVSVVHTITLKYGVSKNTTTFPIPETSLYIAPMGVTSVADSRAVYIDKIPAIAKGTTIPDGGGSISLPEGSPARAEFVKYIQSPTTPFVLLGVAKPVVKAGDAMPAGEIWLRVIPEFVVGLPR